MTPSLEQQLQQTLRLLDSYTDLLADQTDDPAFVARGNGFCDTKYSEDFLLMQIQQLTARAASLRQQINLKS